MSRRPLAVGPTSDRELLTQKADVLIEALPWLERLQGATVVVKYGGNAMTDARAPDVVRRGRRVPASGRTAAGRRAWWWATDLQHARPTRHKVAVPRRPAGDHTRGDGRRAHGPHRPGAARDRRTHQPARPARGRHVRGGCPPVHRDSTTNRNRWLGHRRRAGRRGGGRRLRVRRDRARGRADPGDLERGSRG